MKPKINNWADHRFCPAVIQGTRLTVTSSERVCQRLWSVGLWIYHGLHGFRQGTVSSRQDRHLSPNMVHVTGGYPVVLKSPCSFGSLTTTFVRN
jgi:hypothetical protein